MKLDISERGNILGRYKSKTINIITASEPSRYLCKNSPTTLSRKRIHVDVVVLLEGAYYERMVEMDKIGVWKYDCN